MYLQLSGVTFYIHCLEQRSLILPGLTQCISAFMSARVSITQVGWHYGWSKDWPYGKMQFIPDSESGRTVNRLLMFGGWFNRIQNDQPNIAKLCRITSVKIYNSSILYPIWCNLLYDCEPSIYYHIKLVYYVWWLGHTAIRHYHKCSCVILYVYPNFAMANIFHWAK